MTDTRQRYSRLEPQNKKASPASPPANGLRSPPGSVHTAQHQHDADDTAGDAQLRPANAFEVLSATGLQGEQAQTMHHGGSFRTYMDTKVTKLREQFESNSYHVAPISNLFKGISIFVNGYTKPSGQELKQLMLLHSGRFENYLYHNVVTHIICSNLPDTKIKQMAHERNPLPIVRPEWITASLEAGRILPIKDFQLLPLSDAPGQRKLLGFKQHQAPLPLAQHMYHQLLHQEQAAGEQQQGLQGPGGQVQQPNQQQLEHVVPCSNPPHQTLHPDPPGQQHHHHQQAHHPTTPGAVSPSHPVHLPPAALLLNAPQNEQALAGDAGNSTAGVQQQGPAGGGAGPQQQQQERAGDDEMRAAQDLCAQLRAACDVLRGAPKSSWDNPQFMDDFFRSSRLHFIGTWKSRIEALMAEGADTGPQPRQVQAARPIVDLLQGRTPAASTSTSACAAPPAAERVIVHIDMDCFFASVAVAAHPILKGKPLVVSHSASAKGRGEVSAANYEARAYGICAEMAIGEAKKLCPHLLVVPYMFDRYQEVSEKVYHILLRYSTCVQPLSCDEAYLDVTGLGDADALVAALRQDIVMETGCAASAGIGPNMLVARLATRKAKPDGQHRVQTSQVLQFMSDLPVGELPGVGWALSKKLKDLGITSVRQVWAFSKEQLQRQLGAKTGQALWGYAHGRDDRPVEQPRARKSVGAEVNWGIRFTDWDDVTHFLRDLSNEVAQRMKTAGVQGKSITLKLKRRQAGAPAPWKLLGHGPCDNLSRSVTLGSFTDNAEVVFGEVMALATALAVPPEDMRGVGIAMAAPAPKQYNPRALNAWPALSELSEEQAGSGIRSPQLRPPAAAPAPGHPVPGSASTGAAAGGSQGQQGPQSKVQKQLQLHDGVSDLDTVLAMTGLLPGESHQGKAGSAGGDGLGTALAALHAAAAARADHAGGAGAARGVKRARAGSHGPLLSPCHSGEQESSAEDAGCKDQYAVLDDDGDEVCAKRGKREVADVDCLPAKSGTTIKPGSTRPSELGSTAQEVARKNARLGEGSGSLQKGAVSGGGQQQQEHRQGGAAHEAGGGARLVELPPVDLVDLEVLAALPEDVRRELRAAYGTAIQGLPPVRLGSSSANSTGRRQQAAAAAAARGGSGGRGGAGKRSATAGKKRGVHPAGSSNTNTSDGGSHDGAGGGAAAAKHQTRLTSSGVISLGAARQPQGLFNHRGVFVGGGDSTGGGGGGRAEPGHAKQHTDITASQIDLTVLAELPEEIRREVLNSFAGQGKHHNRRAGGGGSGSVSAAGGGQVLKQQGQVMPPLHPQVQAGGGVYVQGDAAPVPSAAGVVQQLEAGQVYVDEPAGVILQSFRRLVHQVMCEADGHGGTGGVQDLHHKLVHQAFEGPAQGLGQVDAAAEQELPRGMHERLVLACEHLLQWVLSRAWDLESQGAVLAMLRQLGGKWPRLSWYVRCCVDVIQDQVGVQYGLVLEPICLL